MCENEDEMLSVVKHLQTHASLKMVRLKNYFSKKNLDPAHFRRLGITLALPLPNPTERLYQDLCRMKCEILTRLRVFRPAEQNNKGTHSVEAR